MATFDPNRPFQTLADAEFEKLTKPQTPATPAPAAGIPVFNPNKPFTREEEPADATLQPQGPVFDPTKTFNKVFNLEEFTAQPEEVLDKDSDFRPVEFGEMNQEALRTNPELLAKLVRIYRARETRGTSLGEKAKALAKGTPEVLGAIGKGLATAGRTVYELNPVALLARAAGAASGAGAQGVEGEAKRVAGQFAEIPASIEASAAGTGDLLRRSGREVREGAAGLVGGGKKALSDTEWRDRFFDDVAGLEQSRRAGEGNGEVMQALGIDAEELKTAGIELRPEVIQELSVVTDPINYIPVGAAIGAVSKLGGKISSRIIGTAVSAEQAANFAKILNSATKATSAGVGRAARATGAAIETVGRTAEKGVRALGGTASGVGLGAILGGNVYSALGGAAVAKATPRLIQGVGAGIRAGGEILSGVRQPGLLAQSVGAVAGQTARGVGEGLLLTLPFALGARPEEEQAILGAAGVGGVVRGTLTAANVGARAAGRAAQNALSETIFREIDQAEAPTSETYGTDPTLDTQHAAAIANLDDRSAKLVNWTRELFRDSGVEAYVLDRNSFAKQSGTGNAHGYALDIGQTQAPDGTVKPLVRIFLNRDAEALPHELFHALSDIDPAGAKGLLDSVQAEWTPEQKQYFETLYNTVLNEGKPESAWTKRLSPEAAAEEAAAEVFSRVYLSQDLSGVAPRIQQRAATFLSSILEKLGAPLGGVGRAPGEAGVSTLGVRPGTRSTKVGQEWIQNLLKRVEERGNVLPETPIQRIIGDVTPQDVTVVRTGPAARTPAPAAPAPTPAPSPRTPLPPATPAPAPSAPAPRARNIRVTREQQNDFAARRADDLGTDRAKDAADRTGDQPTIQRVNEISRLMEEEGNPVLEIDHRGVKTESTSDAPAGRTSRRAEQEAAYIAEGMGAAPESIREAYQKVFVPARWEVVGGKPQLIAMSLDKVIANVHRAVKDAVSAKAEKLVPYEIVDGKLTDNAWGQVVDDVQSYAANQNAGYRGDGQPLTRPTEDIGASIPAQQAGYNPVPIPEDRANFVNLLMGLAPPLTAREVKGGVPGNVKGQVIAEVNRRTPETPAVIRPQDVTKQEFKSQPGRRVAETNPLRNELAAAGVPVRELIEVTERINAGDILSVTPRTDINFKAPVTDIIRGGFLPGGKEFFRQNSVQDIGQAVIDAATPEAFRALTSEMGGLSNAAFRLGANLKDAADVATLRQFQDQALAKIGEARAARNLEQMTTWANRKQFFTEALQTATGEGGERPVLKEFLGPDYKPPFPELNPERGNLLPTPSEPIRSIADQYARTAGIDYAPSQTYVPVNENLARRLADFYERAESSPNDPEVKKAYEAFARETDAQGKAIVDAGYTIEPWTKEGEPYKNSDEMLSDVRDNKHLYYRPTEENYGAGFEKEAKDNLVLQESKNFPGQSYNDVFRWVHDFFGHGKEGYQFGPRGEFNAWRAHSEMFSPEALPAMSAETLAQNSWVNYGPQAEGKALKDRPFAEQKTVVVPENLIAEARFVEPNLLPASRIPEAKDPIERAAVRTRSGHVVTGSWHGEAVMNLVEQVGSGKLDDTATLRRVNADNVYDLYDNGYLTDGFVTKSGKFLNREEAINHAEDIGQVPRTTNETLESDRFQQSRRFLPEDIQELVALTADQVRPARVSRGPARAVRSASVRLDDGKIVEGPIHASAIMKALEEDPYYRGSFEDGFTTNGGEFLTREQALERAKEIGQVPEEQDPGAASFGLLESKQFDRNRRFLPRQRRDEQGRPLNADGTVNFAKWQAEAQAERKAPRKESDLSKYEVRSKSSRKTVPKSLTSWILPNQENRPIDTAYHEEYLANNAEDLNKRFGTNFDASTSEEGRLDALNKGFVRIRAGHQAGGTLNIELNSRFFKGPTKRTIESLLGDRAEDIDRLKISLLNDEGNQIDTASVNVVELEGAERADALLNAVNSLRSGKLLPSTKESLQREFIGRDDTFWGVRENEFTGGQTFESGYSAVQCTGFACAIRQKLGPDRVKVFGFLEDDNPTSEIAQKAGGHDFAVVDNRFIVDPWITEVENIGNQAVFDLETDKETVDRLYGDRDKWKLQRSQPGRLLPAGELPGIGETSEANALKRQLKKRAADVKDEFPEALPLQYLKDSDGNIRLDNEGKPRRMEIEYNLLDTPVAREAAKGIRGDEEREAAVAKALGDLLAKLAKEAKKNPDIKAGEVWYSLTREKLRKTFGDDTKFFAELLGATSARTKVGLNFQFALEAYNQFKQGKYDAILKKYREGKTKWETQDIADFRRENKSKEPTRAAFLDWWITKHDLTPLQSNGKKFGMNSRAVLKVLDGTWMQEVQGPKTPNFTGNLTGDTFEATIDVWAARTLHRLANEGNEKRWRILPLNETGVNDKDFFLGQAAFRHAAEKLGMKPDSLQALIWFAEKDHWEKQGWADKDAAEKSDFNTLLGRTVRDEEGQLTVQRKTDDTQKELSFDDVKRKK